MHMSRNWDHESTPLAGRGVVIIAVLHLGRVVRRCLSPVSHMQLSGCTEVWRNRGGSWVPNVKDGHMQLDRGRVGHGNTKGRRQRCRKRGLHTRGAPRLNLLQLPDLSWSCCDTEPDTDRSPRGASDSLCTSSASDATVTVTVTAASQPEHLPPLA